MSQFGSNPNATVQIADIESLAKGTVIVGDGSGAPSTLAVGSNNQVFTADSSQTSGIKWADATTAPFSDSSALVKNAGDSTKQGMFSASGITSGQTRTFTLPDANTTLVGTDTTQTLSNKVIDTPTIANFGGANHNHQNIQGGGTLSISAISSSTSAQLASVISDETGSGLLVFATSPTLTTPNIGVATATSVNKVALTAPASSATLTIADGKTLTASNSLTLAGTDGTTMTFPSTSASIARTDAANTFTGVQSMTSPNVTTSITTPSTTFALVNATATTVNFAGAATTLNIGGSGAAINLGGGASAAELRFLEPSASGTNYMAFKAQAMAADVTYTLPAADGSSGQVLSTNGTGTLSWTTAGGVTWGDTRTSGTGTGLTHTIGASVASTVIGYSGTINNTQANSVIAMQLLTGTSGWGTGLLIKGSTDQVTTGTKCLLVLHENLASALDKVLTIGSGASFTESAYVTANGTFYLKPVVGNDANYLTFDVGTTITSTTNLIATSGAGNVAWVGAVYNFDHRPSGTLSDRTNPFASLTHSRTSTRTSLTTADNYDLLYLDRRSTQNGVGGTLTAAGSVLYVQNTATQTAGTLTDSVICAKIIQSANSTGVPLQITQNAVVSTNFRKIITESVTGISIWISNGNTPNAALSGTAGDICLNGATSLAYYCTGTTNWTAM